MSGPITSKISSPWLEKSVQEPKKHGLDAPEHQTAKLWDSVHWVFGMILGPATAIPMIGAGPRTTDGWILVFFVCQIACLGANLTLLSAPLTGEEAYTD